MTKIVNFIGIRKKGPKNGEKCLFFWEIWDKINKLEDIERMVVLRSSPNNMEQLLKFSNLYLKPILS